jgi:hypothetical protein
MTVDQPALDLTAGRAARDRALANVDRAADDEWRADADTAIAQLAATGRPFVSDDVWEQGLVRVRENRALGARIQAAARAGIIKPTGQFRQTAQVKSHASPRREWIGVG